MNRSTMVGALLLGLVAAHSAFHAADARVSEAEWKAAKAEYLKLQADPERRAAAIVALGRCDHPEAVKILLKLLGSQDPQYGALLAERAAVIAELVESQKFGKECQEKGRLFSQGEADRLNAKHKALEDKVAALDVRLTAIHAVRYAAIEALYETGDDEAYALLLAAVADPKWEVRSGALQALGRCGTIASRPTIRAAIADKDPKVQAAAIDASARREDKEAEAAIVLQLANKAWQVRVAAVQALASFKSLTAVGPLVTALQAEDGRMREDLDQALLAITGFSHGGDPANWKAWYEGNKDRLAEVVAARLAEAKHEKVRGGSVSFYGIETQSKNLCFVIDVSGSMEQKAGKPAESKESTGDGAISGRGSGAGASARAYPVDGTKMDVANYELIKAVEALPDDALFNIVYFSTDVGIYAAKGMIKATDAAKKQTVQWIEQTLKPTLGTNIFDSLEYAINLNGALDASYKKGVDTIFFLTDGKPTHGRVRETDKILTEVASLNAIRKIKIHVIGVGKVVYEDAKGELGGPKNDADKAKRVVDKTKSEIDVDFLRKLAEGNGGTFAHRE